MRIMCLTRNTHVRTSVHYTHSLYIRCEEMAKRSREQLEDFDDVSRVTHSSPNAKLSGVVWSVSPMRPSKTCSYFDGEISDVKSTSTMRLFGFDGSVRRKLLARKSSSVCVVLSRTDNRLLYLSTRSLASRRLLSSESSIAQRPRPQTQSATC